MKTFVSIFAFMVGASAIARADAPVLVSPQWLHDHQQDANVVIVQVCGIKFDYLAEHIAGSRYLWPELLAPNSPDGNMNAPDPRNAAEVVQSLGISNSSHVVLVYVRGEIPATARMFMTFEYLGMKGNVSLLNGGLDAWKKAGFPVTKDLPVVKVGKFEVLIDPVIVDRAYVAEHLKSSSTSILDCRPTNVFNGDPVGFPRAGHIAGAKSLPYTEMFDSNNTFKPDSQLQGYFDNVVGSKDKEVVTYCFIGQTACVVYLAGRVLGYPMKLYDGSAQEWSRYSELPMEVTPKPAEAKQ